MYSESIHWDKYYNCGSELFYLGETLQILPESLTIFIIKTGTLFKERIFQWRVRAADSCLYQWELHLLLLVSEVRLYAWKMSTCRIPVWFWANFPQTIGANGILFFFFHCNGLWKRAVLTSYLHRTSNIVSQYSPWKLMNQINWFKNISNCYY